MAENTVKKQVINWYASMGVDDLIADIPVNTSDVSQKRAGVTVQKHQVAQSEGNNSKSESRVLADNVSTLADLKKVVMEFNGCALKKFASNTVFADGIDSADIMLIGEAPGAKEDAQGIPFCGDSGKLLDAMMASIGLSRTQNIYITNTVFWRPPANRTPTAEEIDICRPFLEKHISLVKPKLLILVGGTAINSLLGSQFRISNIRQKYCDYSNQYLDHPIKLTAIFHPAYLLRQPSQKKTTWYDLLKIKEFLIA